MCGIAGFLALAPQSAEATGTLLQRMTDQILHRGPDGEGHWQDAALGIGLGHRRLAILDLSSNGHQPMVSPCGRFVLSFNGEIYNHFSMRADMAATKGPSDWNGHSDTETLLAAIAHWGLADALCRCAGMFALGLWDKKEKTLSLARDRMGEKPLYFGKIGSFWGFSSEVRALRVLPNFSQTLDPAAVAMYLAYGYVPEPQSIHKDISKVAPGSIVTLAAHQEPQLSCYEAFAQLVDQAAQHTPAPDFADRSLALETELDTVISEQMLSDVPLGCFLSGGVDSSLVASLMQKGSHRQIETFSIGFKDSRFNEAPHAANIAKHLGTAHSEFILLEEDALAIVPDLPQIYDEPFADSSQIPTTLLCQMARKKVTVALTGDGADEIFGGYNRHVHGPKLWRYLSYIPRPLRYALGRTLSFLDKSGLPQNERMRYLERKFKLPVTTLDKLSKLGDTIGTARGIPDVYHHLTRGFVSPSEIMTMPADEETMPPSLSMPNRDLDPAHWMMAKDSLSYLPGDILVKVDRAAMHSSLETRAPFLDHRIISMAWRLPSQDKISGSNGKHILKDILYRHIPKEMLDRPKQGFAIPLDRWLREGLHDWANDLFARQDLLVQAGLKTTVVHALWQAHVAQRANNGQKLWTLLMLLDWLQAQNTHLPRHVSQY